MNTKIQLNRQLSLLVLLVGIASGASAASFQFEVLGVSGEWLVVRENVRGKASDVAACRYPGLDPSQSTGAQVLFIPLSEPAKHGRLFEFDARQATSKLPLYAPNGTCTSPSDADNNWKTIRARAKELSVPLAPKLLQPVVLGAPVSARECVLTGKKASPGQSCVKTYTQVFGEDRVRIDVSLSAVPEMPDGRSCQFIGHRFGAVIQVSGLDFATEDSDSAPGGFVNHYDCRDQQFLPIRLYRSGDQAVLLGAFEGTNIADREEHPFIIFLSCKN